MAVRVAILPLLVFVRCLWTFARSLCIMSLLDLSSALHNTYQILVPLIQKSKSLVTPAWLRDSLHKGSPQSCGDYAAIPDLQPSTAANCPTDNSDSGSESDSDLPNARSMQDSPPSSAPPSHTSQAKPSSDSMRSDVHSSIPANLLPPNPPPTFDPKSLDPLAKFACERPSPLKCVNQKLAEDLDVMRRWRELEGEERSALSYRKAVSVCNFSLAPDVFREPLLIAVFTGYQRWVLDEHIR